MKRQGQEWCEKIGQRGREETNPEMCMMGQGQGQEWDVEPGM